MWDVGQGGKGFILGATPFYYVANSYFFNFWFSGYFWTVSCNAPAFGQICIVTGANSCSVVKKAFSVFFFVFLAQQVDCDRWSRDAVDTIGDLLLGNNCTISVKVGVSVRHSLLCRPVSQ